MHPSMMTPKEKKSHARKEKIKKWAKGMTKNQNKPKLGGKAKNKPISRRIKHIFG